MHWRIFAPSHRPRSNQNQSWPVLIASAPRFEFSEHLFVCQTDAYKWIKEVIKIMTKQKESSIRRFACGEMSSRAMLSSCRLDSLLDSNAFSFVNQENIQYYILVCYYTFVQRAHHSLFSFLSLLVRILFSNCNKKPWTLNWQRL